MNNTWKQITLWTLILTAMIIEIVLGVNEKNLITQIGPVIIVICIFTFTLLHGMVRYGARDLLIFFAISFIVSWSYEQISIITGFPFGHYYYTGQLGPKILFVPIIIMPAYFGTAYLAWTLSHILLDVYDSKIKVFHTVAIPLVASFIMVMWDVCMDPYMATILNNWIWIKGGGFYGVPFTNFLGWYLCVYTFYQMFAVYLYKKKDIDKPAYPFPKMYWLQPAVLYMTSFIFYLFKILYAGNDIITTPDGKTWWSQDIYQAAFLMTINTMVFVALIAIIKIFIRKKALPI
jgi:uncharacterized membrane protein